MPADKPARARRPSGNGEPGWPLDAPGRRRLPFLLRRCWYNLNQTFRRRIAHLGITPDQFTALRTVLEGSPKGLTQRQLTELMSSDPNTIAALLERMETLGLVERKVHEHDRRANRITLTPAGQLKFLEVREIALGLQMEVLAVLPKSKHEEFLGDLAQIAEACRQAAEQSGG